jgi:hypothetical protein
MRAVPIPVLTLALMLAACSKGSDVMEALPNNSIAGAPREDVPETRMDAAQTRAVTIGEDGPRLDACGGMGQVIRVGARGLAVRSAPFIDAPEVGRMAEGERAYVCTRSVDQQWLGVVLPPPSPVGGFENNDGAGPAPMDCGVSEPADRKRAYAGPCASGWVASASIRLVG